MESKNYLCASLIKDGRFCTYNPQINVEIVDINEKIDFTHSRVTTP